jgi:hypothetical protein
VSGFVPEHPVELAPGIAEMLADPNHFRRAEMAVVDYAKVGPVLAGPLGWEPLLPCSEPDHPSAGRWTRLGGAFRRRN